MIRCTRLRETRTVGRAPRMGTILLGILVTAWTLGGSGPRIANGQQPVDAGDPFGARNPFGANAPQPADPAGQAASGDDAVDLTGEKDPVVLAIFDAKPTTPAELFRSARILRDLQRYELARKLLLRLLKTNPDPPKLAELQRQFGPAAFVELMRDTNLAPEGRTLAMKVVQAGDQQATDPQYLQRLIQQLSAATPKQRYDAEIELQRSGHAGVMALLRVLADPQQVQSHAAVRDALVSMQSGAIEPLLGVMSAPQESLKIQAMEVLGRIRAREAVPLLLAPYLAPQSSPAVREAAGLALDRIVGYRPSPREARVYLRRQTEMYLAGVLPKQPDLLGRIELWFWSPQERTSVPRRLPHEDASLVVAARLAGQLYALQPTSNSVRRLYLATNLAAAKILQGEDRPLPTQPGSIAQVAAASGVDVVEDLLDWSLKHQPLAAAGACEVLGNLGDASVLDNPAGAPRTLIRAVEHSDRRVRFAATDAVLRLDPQRSYPGSSRVLSSLEFLINSLGERRILVASPRLSHAGTMVGLLNQLGYDAIAVDNGRDAHRLATESPDFEMIFVSDTLDKPNAYETIQLLRGDPRTADLPIGVLSQSANRADSIYAQMNDDLVEVFIPPFSPRVAGFEVQKLRDLLRRGMPQAEQRLRQAAVCLAHLIRLVQNPSRYDFYDLLGLEQSLESVLRTPELAQPVAEVLGHLGTPRAQRALVNLASQNALPLEERQAAADAFQRAVSLRGLLLTTDEIRLQYSRYNLSERLDPGTQKVLSSLLDAIEGPSSLKAVQAKLP